MVRFGADAESEADVSSFYAALRSRSEELQSAAAVIESRWRSGSCVSRVAVSCGDWIRRMAFDRGVVAFGTAGGGVGVAAVGEAVADQPVVCAVHPAGVEGQDLRALHGDFDGGGVTALALEGEACVSGGRDGFAVVHRVLRGKGDGSGPTLEAGISRLEVGKQPVSGVVVAEGGKAAVAVSLDGRVVAFAKSDDDGGAWKQTWAVDAPSPLLAVALDERRGAVVVGSATGAAHAHALSDGARLATWQAHRRSGCRSLVVLKDTVYCGANDGAISSARLLDDVFELAPPRKDGSNGALLPPHGEAVVALAATPRGLLCSAARDGSLRVWSVADDAKPPKALYGFGGYKVWIGSLACDDATLISDGSDNAIICHKFDEEKPGDA